jgi:ATP-dependent protease ClpP protease subunit
MLDIYVSRCKDGQYWKREGMDEKAIREWIADQIDRKQEFYMTPRESVDRGFMDAVLGDEEFETIAILREEDE